MKVASIPDEFDADAARDSGAERVARQARGLAELAEIGLSLAREMKRRAVDDPAATTEDLGVASLAFSRVSRAVRLCWALETQLAEARSAREEVAEAARAQTQAAAEDRRRTLVAGGFLTKCAVRDAMGEIIEAQDHLDDEAVESLLDEVSERLDETETADYFAYPIGPIIAAICHDLGIEPNWDDWDEDWVEEARDWKPPRTRGASKWAGDDIPGVRTAVRAVETDLPSPRPMADKAGSTDPGTSHAFSGHRSPRRRAVADRSL